MKELEELTEEQTKYIDVFREELLSSIFDPDKRKYPDKAAITKHINWLYEFCSLPLPEEIVITESPFAAQVVANARAGNTELTYFNFSYYGSISDYPWMGRYKYFQDIGVDIDVPGFNEFYEYITSGIYDTILFDTVAIVCRLPRVINRDSDFNLHSDSGPAVEWDDGFKLYYYHGISIPDFWIEEGVTLAIINTEDNAELRRVAIALYGHGRYLEHSKAKVVDRFDPGYILYDLPDEELKILECWDSTPENLDPGETRDDVCVQRFEFRPGEVAVPGAWYKKYFLEMPYECNSAKEAVALSYGISVERLAKYLTNLKET